MKALPAWVAILAVVGFVAVGGSVAATEIDSRDYQQSAQAVVTVAVPPTPVAPGAMVTVEIRVDVGSDALGAYDLTLACDPDVLEIIPPVLGGATFEFSGLPIQNVSGCNASIGAFQIMSLDSPVGAASVARVTLRVRPSAVPGSISVLDLTPGVITVPSGEALDSVAEDAVITVAGQRTSTTVTTVTTLDPTTTSTTVPARASCGDLTDDGLITASDALAALWAAVGVRSCDLSVCDVDGTGQVTPTDALRILKFATGQPIAMQCPVRE